MQNSVIRLSILVSCLILCGNARAQHPTTGSVTTQPADHALSPEDAKLNAHLPSLRYNATRKYLNDNVDTNSWKDNGGDLGERAVDQAKSVLIITRTPENQRKVAAALKGIREANLARTRRPTTAP